MPIGLFFSGCSILMALLAVVFTGHGVKALQEAGVMPTDPVSFVTVQALGIYPNTQALTAQIVVLAIVIAGFFYGSRAAARAALDGGEA